MNALIFPGQGAQVVGMGSEFYKKFNLVKNIFKIADEVLNFSMTKMILEGPADQLQLTKNTQPAILTVSYSIFKIMKDEFNFSLNNFKYLAGHSLGEYSALVSSDSLKFEDALYLLHERGKAMQEAVPVGKGSMIAVLGTSIDQLKDLIKKIDDKNGICEIANDNADGQIIISGETETVSLFQTLLKQNKIKTIPLKVSAPFHCSLMRSAADSMKEKINKTTFQKPKIEIIHNVTTKPENDVNKIKNLLIEQIYSSVRWRESLIYMFDTGVLNYIEIGPGKALTGMVNRTLKNVNCFSINEITDIKNLNNEFRK